jgi:hypothetical protein
MGGFFSLLLSLLGVGKRKKLINYYSAERSEQRILLLGDLKVSQIKNSSWWRTFCI